MRRGVKRRGGGEVREEERERSEGESPIFLCALDTIIQCISSCFNSLHAET